MTEQVFGIKNIHLQFYFLFSLSPRQILHHRTPWQSDDRKAKYVSQYIQQLFNLNSVPEVTNI